MAGEKERKENLDLACKLCPAHPYVLEQLANNKNDIKWIMRTQVTQLGTTLIAAIGIAATLSVLVLKILPLVQR